MDFSAIFNKTILGDNSVWQILALFFALLVGFAVGKLLKYLFLKRSVEIKEVKPILSIGFESAGRGIQLLSFVIALSLGVGLLSLGDAHELISTIVSILFTLGIGYMAYCMVDLPREWMIRRASGTPSKMDDMLAPIISKSLRATIVVLAVVQIAQILSGKEVTSILAGLGIGGLAFALAAQDTIKNFFGSVVLLFDKPFEIGDRVNIDGHDGPVEEVGLRSTKIRTLDGHLVTMPNGELANKAIWNIAKRPYIRRLFDITITYDTPPEKVREAKAILEDILKDHEGMNEDFPPRVYFNKFNDSSLNLFCIYWYFPPAYWDFLNFGERVNLEILERFNAAGIEFAFPTQTLHVEGDFNGPPPPVPPPASPAPQPGASGTTTKPTKTYKRNS
ncbi:MAG: mechanosensitive ion channel family protein [Verrucomicrobiota bacterium]